MRRFIFSTSHNVYGMSTKRSDARDAVKALQSAIVEHLCKCVVYKNSLGSLEFWIKELASFFDEANDVEVDKKGRKFSTATYEDLLFSQFGNDTSDKVRILKHFSSTDVGKGDLPYTPITLDMVDALVYAANSLKKQVCPLLAMKNELTKIDFRKIILQIFEDAGIT